MKQKISIYIVEDYILIRKSLIHVLGKDASFKILGDYDNAEDFLVDFEKAPSDIVIMDLGLPGMNGLEATLKLKQMSQETKVVILTSHEKDDEVLAALASGANAYCLKDLASEELAPIIKDVNKGVMWLHPSVSDIAVKNMPKPISLEFNNLYKENSNEFDLTDREREILALVVDGKTNTEIAEILNISAHTAKAHVCNILTKLSVTDRVQAAVKAIRAKIVE